MMSREKNIALFRYGIISPAVTGTFDDTLSLKGFFRDAAKKVYTNPRGEDTRIAASTIERWFYAYQKDGFDALLPKRRTDTGKPRKLDADITEQIRFLKKEYPRIPATLIHQKLIDNGTIRPGDVSLSTITRFVNLIK
ncbi:MAG: helix-turn-helix domain-containing protein, partial [Lachnospiraceae bacterium]|nr:helix-turn-helix domain-containing protein [Lachnospiraceae bacterium]